MVIFVACLFEKFVLSDERLGESFTIFNVFALVLLLLSFGGILNSVSKALCFILLEEEFKLQDCM